MGSRDDQTTTHQLSSLVVRPTDSGGAGDGANGQSPGGTSSDYEPGEVRRNDPPPYSRSDRFSDSHGYRMRTGSISPVRHHNHRYNSPDLGRGFRNFSPPNGRGGRGGGSGGGGGGGGRFTGRGFDRPFRDGGGGGALPRKVPNVKPREGDWMCPDPSCNNLNFARREYCNKCKTTRLGGYGMNHRRGYPGPPPPPHRRFPGPPFDRSPIRIMHRSPPPRGGWGRGGGGGGGGGGGPRDFRHDRPPPPPPHHFRHSSGPIRRERQDYQEDEYRERGSRFPPPPPPVVPVVAPPPPSRGGYIRERSRSPIRGTAAPPKDHHRDGYVERGRDRRGMGMGRGGY